MPASRSPWGLLARMGLYEHTVAPRPRLCPADLLVYSLPPNSPPEPSTCVLLAAEGGPPPDRGASRAWPGR